MDIERQITQGNNSVYNENNISHIIINSVDYKNLLEEIEDLKEDIADISNPERKQKKIDKLAEKK